MITLRSATPALALALALVSMVARPLSADEPTPTVGGTIKLRDKPLAAGKIFFHLKDDEFVGGKVRDGAYKLTRVPAGPCRVSIEAEGMPANFASEKATPLTVDLKPGANTIDFDIK